MAGWHHRLTPGVGDGQGGLACYSSWGCKEMVDQAVKYLSAMQETWVHSLGQEDSLEKGMATHSSILAWRIPWTEEPGGLQSMGLQSWTRLSD